MAKMLKWLGEACRQAREGAKRDQQDIADLVPARRGNRTSASTVSRLERGVAWPHQLDEMMEGYALISGQMPYDLWQTALNLWISADDVGRDRRRKLGETVAAESAREATSPESGRSGHRKSPPAGNRRR